MPFTSVTILTAKLSSPTLIASARHLPDIMLLPESSLSPHRFTTGSDSPVSTDSFTSTVPSSISQSQHTTEPLSRQSVSPHTTSSERIIMCEPPRSTLTRGCDMMVRRSICRFAFIS